MIYKESLFTSLGALWSKHSQFDFLNGWFLITSTPRRLTWQWKITIFNRRYMGFVGRGRLKSARESPQKAACSEFFVSCSDSWSHSSDGFSLLACLSSVYTLDILNLRLLCRCVQDSMLRGGFCGFVGPMRYVAWMVSSPITVHSSDTLCNPMNHRWACGLVVQGWLRGAFRIFDSMFAKNNLPPLKQTWQWKIHHLKMYCIYFLLKMGDFPSLC